jgi:hypothetical protein
MPYKKKHGRNSNYHAGIICSLAIALLLSSSTVTQAASYSYYWSVTSGRENGGSNCIVDMITRMPVYAPHTCTCSRKREHGNRHGIRL